MDIAVLLYPRFTALDAVGPYEVLARIPGADVAFVASTAGPVYADTGRLALVAETTIAELRKPDIVVVPGGPGQSDHMEDLELLSWLSEAHATSTWTSSVCTGSLLLGAAGILQGKRATSHWLAVEQLSGLGAVPVSERVVFDGKIVTAAGVSAGIDMALSLAEKLAGTEVAQIIQLGIEYDPQPPLDSGSPAKAPPNVTAYLRSRSRFALRDGSS